MSENKHDKELRESVGKEILTLISYPCDWNGKQTESFTPTMSDLKDYFILIVKGKNTDKIELIQDFFGIPPTKSLEEQIEWIKSSNKTKSMEKFFRNDGIPIISTLDFIATIFEVYQKKKEVVKDEGEVELKESIQKQRIGLKIVSSLVIVLLLIAGYKYISMSMKFDKAQTKLSEIDQLSFRPEFASANLLENDTTKMKIEKPKPITITNSNLKLSYFTNSLYNSKFIYTSTAWEFKTDPNGEDMNSKYGEPFRNDIQKLKPFKENYTTLANESLTIRFNVKNESSETIFIDNLLIKILNVYDVQPKTMFYNVYMPENMEKKYKLTFNLKTGSYPIATFAELTSGSPQHFALFINGDQSCNKKIFKFSISVSCNDGKGNRFTVDSDKIYFLGFVDDYSEIRK